jgi:hypothetical protein
LILPIQLSFAAVGLVGIGTVATIFGWPLDVLPILFQGYFRVEVIRQQTQNP